MTPTEIRQVRNEAAVFLSEVNESLKDPENNHGSFFEFSKEVGDFVTPHGRKFTIRVTIESEE